MSTPDGPIVPACYIGKWVAWSADGMEILGTGETLREAEETAIQSGESEPILERVPGRSRLRDLTPKDVVMLRRALDTFGALVPADHHWTATERLLWEKADAILRRKPVRLPSGPVHVGDGR